MRREQLHVIIIITIINLRREAFKSFFMERTILPKYLKINQFQIKNNFVGS